MRNCTKNTAIGEATALCAIATQQLPLFVGLPTEEVDLPPYPLQIKAIPYEKRVNPNRYCKLVHYESRLNIPGQFSHDEAKEILETTRYWDFGSRQRQNTAMCRERLRSLLEDVCARSLQVGGKADA